MTTLLLVLGCIIVAELIILPLSIAISKEVDSFIPNESPEDIKKQEHIKKDRLRYTKNSLSSTLAIIAIVFNVLYFVSIYGKLESDVGSYYYTYTMGFSVVCNLLFLLFTFLCSEGIKNYKYSYSVGLIFLGSFQLFRIFGYPMDATKATIGNTAQPVMTQEEFLWACVFLALSALFCFASSIVGFIKTKTLKTYLKQINQ